MNFGIHNRGELEPVVEDEFEGLTQALSRFLSVGHDDNGNVKAPIRYSFVPIGAILLWPTDAIPTGFLACDGSIVSRDQYAQLFRVIGILYGPGDGSSTFEIPTIADLGSAHYVIAAGTPVRTR